MMSTIEVDALTQVGPPWTDVRRFGAKVDGVTDDRAAVIATLAAVAGRGGGTVYIPTGVCLVRSIDGHRAAVAITASNVTLTGDGPGSILRNDVIEPSGDGNGVLSIIADGHTVDNVQVRDLSLENAGGRYVPESAGIGLIYVAGRSWVSGLTIRGCTVVSRNRTGISLGAFVRDFRIIDNDLTGPGETGIYLAGMCLGGFVAPVDADRVAAEWLLSVKRDPVMVRVGGQERAVRTAKDLPDAPFQVVDVTLWGNPVVTDAGLAHLKGLAHLRSLELHDTRVGDDGLAHLRGLPALELLSLRYTLVSDVGLAHLRGLPRLANLDLAGTRVTDAGLATLRDLPNLAKLSLNGTRVTDAGLSDLRALPGLERLELELTGVTDAASAALRGASKLRHLFLGGTSLTDDGLGQLRALPALNLISLWGTRVTDEGLRHLGAVPGLYEAWLDAGLLTDAGLGHLRALPGLVNLGLYRAVDADLARLAAPPNLTGLGLSFSRVTDAELEHLRGMEKLKTISLKATGVTATGADRLRRLLPGCEVQWQPWGDETDRHAVEWVLATGGKARLQWMAAEWPAEALGDLPGGRLSLAGVDLGGRRHVADADLAKLRFRSVLRILNLSGTGVSDAGLAHLRNLLKLSYLDLSGTAVTDTGLAHLATLRNLAELSLTGTAVTDAGLAHLRSLAQLRELDLTGTNVTGAGVADLRKALPRCQVRTGLAD
jgi:Leucine-rich repeat (LRR) protein